MLTHFLVLFLIFYPLMIVSNFTLFASVDLGLNHRLRPLKCLLLSTGLSLFIVPKLLLRTVMTWQWSLLNLITLAAYVWILHRFFDDTPLRKLTAGAFFLTIQGLGDALGYSFTAARLGYGPDILDWSYGDTLLYMSGSTVMIIFLMGAALPLFRMVSMRRFRPFYLLFFLYPLSQWLFMYSFLMERVSWVWYAGVALGVVSEILLVYYVITQEEREKLRDDLRETRHLMELEQAHYREVEERQEELSRIRHDFNNQLAAIGRLVRMGEGDEAGHMLDNLTEAVAAARAERYCGIPVVDAVLTEKAGRCREAGIRFEAELEMPESLPVESLHLCSIFSNLLDNAIKAVPAAGVQDPYVSLRSKPEGDYLFIKTCNPAAPPPAREARQGLGTHILRSIAEQYGGTYETEWSGGVFTAIVTVLLSPAGPDRPPAP